MKTIQIPAKQFTRKLVRTECVQYCDVLRICFSQAGLFYRDAGGDQFDHALPLGPVSAGLTEGFTAPNKKLDMLWIFKGTGAPVSGILQVRPDARCVESSIPPCP